MIVCVCRRVTDQQIRQAVAQGAESLECLQFALGVAMQCGQCADCATRLLCEAQRPPAHASGRGSVFPIAIARPPAMQGA